MTFLIPAMSMTNPIMPVIYMEFVDVQNAIFGYLDPWGRFHNTAVPKHSTLNYKPCDGWR